VLARARSAGSAPALPAWTSGRESADTVLPGAIGERLDTTVPSPDPAVVN
jgi:hypothetical protein